MPDDDIYESFKRSVWKSYYTAMYYNILFTKASKRWQLFDFISRLLVAITASSSAVAGWALWNDENFKSVWAIIAGVSSLIAIVHATLNAPDKVNTYSKLVGESSKVSFSLESFYQRIKIFKEFKKEEDFKVHLDLRESMQKMTEGYPPDLFVTYYLRNAAQAELNHQLGIPKGEE